jgi:hypothetical protein
MRMHIRGSGRLLGAERLARAPGVLAMAGAVALTMSGAASAQTTWTISRAPTSGYGLLSDVYAASASNAWAVGARAGGGTGQRNQLAEHWDGTAWHAAALPAVSKFSTRLLSVSGTSASNVWAVGDQQTTDTGPYPPEVTLIMHWNGTHWTRVQGPNPGAFITRLEVVKAFGPSDVWASGFSQAGRGKPMTALTVHWDGSTWAKVATPDPAMKVAGGTSGSDVWFMGSAAWHWNGHSFTKVPGPVSHKVAAISPASAWGIATNSQGASVLNHWNGSAWSTVKTLPAGQQLAGLAALSTDDVWAVGMRPRSDGSMATLTMQRKGTTWRTVASPNPANGTFPTLTSAAASGPGTVIAVGEGSGSTGNGTLAMMSTSG